MVQATDEVCQAGDRLRALEGLPRESTLRLLVKFLVPHPGLSSQLPSAGSWLPERDNREQGAKPLSCTACPSGRTCYSEKSPHSRVVSAPMLGISWAQSLLTPFPNFHAPQLLEEVHEDT